MVDGHVVLAGNARMMDDSKITYTKNTGTGTVVYVARDGQFLGSVLIADEVKEHSKQAIAALKAQGVRTIMLTGDSEAVAASSAASWGWMNTCPAAAADKSQPRGRAAGHQGQERYPDLCR